jgi:hypothetical protein
MDNSLAAQSSAYNLKTEKTKHVRETASRNGGIAAQQDRRAITLDRLPETSRYSIAPASKEDIKEVFELENIWPRTKAGDQLFILALRQSVRTDWSGYDFPGPIPPEVSDWVLANLPKGMLEENLSGGAEAEVHP